MAFRVRFMPNDITVEVEEGKTLLEAAMRAGIHLNASCGGAGLCGKCRIILDRGDLDSPRTTFLSESEYAGGVRQACISKVLGDTEVHVPPEASLDARTLNLMAVSRNATRSIQEIGVEQLLAEGRFHPPHQKLRVQVTPPTIEDQTSDLTRLIRALSDQYGLSNLEVRMEVLRKLPQVLREKNFEVTVSVAIAPREENPRVRLVDVEAGDRSALNGTLAIDVGTTTVWGTLINVANGEELGTHAEYNAQMAYGEDVISRISYAGTPEGLRKMQELVVSTINTIIDRLLEQTKVPLTEINRINIAGNTTMTHLLLGIDPQFIRLKPYTPAANLFPPTEAIDLGIHADPDVQVFVFPSVASYVGGDIVAGVLGSGMYRSDKLTLYIDVGTNGEIVVGNRDWMACAACSAGPAFEGGGIRHGMRASRGAIEEIMINPNTYEPMLLTVGKAKPKGICGSGLINTVAAMLRANIINERGKFNVDLPTDRIRGKNGDIEFVLAYGEDTKGGEDIVLTEIDIDNLIRAKGAMFAGYLTLLEGVGLSLRDIEQVIIAGGFGNHINIEHAITIGLLPELDLDRFLFVGNGSLVGAKLASLSNEVRIDAREVLSKMTNFELSESQHYMDYYVAGLFLPHTEKKYFPKVFEMLSRRKFEQE